MVHLKQRSLFASPGFRIGVPMLGTFLVCGYIMSEFAQGRVEDRDR